MEKLNYDQLKEVSGVFFGFGARAAIAYAITWFLTNYAPRCPKDFNNIDKDSFRKKCTKLPGTGITLCGCLTFDKE